MYLGALEEVATAGTSTTTTTYYYAQGQRIAVAVNGAISYVASDALGSATAAFDPYGNALASQLYAPYGGVRYSSGSLPGSYGFTGQRSDAATSGLDYYGARYYDPVAGQFTSADTTLAGGLDRYAYVAGNPETWTDPSGHAAVLDELGSAVAEESPPPPPPPTSGDGQGCGCSATGDTASSTTSVTGNPTTASNPQPGGTPPGPQIGPPPPSQQQPTQQAYVGDTSIFFSRMTSAQATVLQQMYFNNPNVTIYVTLAQVREIGNSKAPYGRQNWYKLWRMTRAAGGAHVIIIPAASLTGVNVPQTRNLNQDDMYMLQTAQMMNLPVLTLNLAIARQVYSYGPARQQWGPGSRNPVDILAYDDFGNRYVYP